MCRLRRLVALFSVYQWFFSRTDRNAKAQGRQDAGITFFEFLRLFTRSIIFVIVIDYGQTLQLNLVNIPEYALCFFKMFDHVKHLLLCSFVKNIMMGTVTFYYAFIVRTV